MMSLCARLFEQGHGSAGAGVLWLAFEYSSYIKGICLHVDGGFLAQWYLVVSFGMLYLNLGTT